MATRTSTYHVPLAGIGESRLSRTASNIVVVLGRIFFAAIFVMAGPMHFSAAEIGYARAAGIPAPGFLVPAAGVLAVVGGLSILLGYHARLGAWLIVLFLIPVTLAMHPFWAAPNQAMAQIQMAMFMKNVSMLGAALLVSQVGAGPWSLDSRRS